MAKGAFFPMLLLLLHVTYAAAAASANGGVEAACEKSSASQICAELLIPYASQFMDNDTNKMGYAAISATLAQVQATRAYMVRQTTEPEATEQERAAVTECLGMVGNSDDSLRMASQEFDELRAAKDERRSGLRESVVKMIDAARADLSNCTDLLKKHTDLIAGGVIAEAARLSDRSVQACSVAEAFVQ